MELFPENPFTTGVEFVSEALSWIARRLVGSLPAWPRWITTATSFGPCRMPPAFSGRGVFGPGGELRTGRRLVQRIIDAGADLFFPTANDLVVPTEGGWRVDPGTGTAAIPGSRVGCFGLGGNLVQQQPVNHVNFFQDPGTVDFLVRALRGQPQPATPIDLEHDLPSGRRRGAARMESPSPAVAATPREEPTATQPALLLNVSAHPSPRLRPRRNLTTCFTLRSSLPSRS